MKAMMNEQASTTLGAGRRHGIISGTPIGELTVVLDDEQVTALYMTEHRHAPEATTYGPRIDTSDPTFMEVSRQLAEYFAGDRTEFDLELNPEGTDFQKIVWLALRDIPYGETVSYGEIARRIGTPSASRAVGLANGRNPISVIVPCHRVIGADGSMTGYGGGLERKRTLLDLERGQASPRLF